MKKIGIAIFCVLSLLVLSLVGNAVAYDPTFEHYLYQGDASPVVDGTYDIGDLWYASGTQTFGTDGIFRDYWVMDPNLLCLLIETSDATDDAGDYWVMCWDSTEDGGMTEPDGGPSPKTNDYKLVVTGHGTSATVEWFKGTGTGWSTTPVTPAEGVLEQAQQLAPYTPKIGTPHYVFEMALAKMDDSLGTPLMGYTWATYIAYYDASTATTQSWPPAPASADVPDSWGFIPYESGANPEPDVPEGIGFVVMLAVSSVAAAGAVLLRKRTKIANIN